MTKTRVQGRAVALVIAVLLVVLTPWALAAGPDTTTLLSRATGTGAVPAPGTGSAGFVVATSSASVPGAHLSSDTGRYVVFVSNADGLSAEDDDGVENVFVRVQGNGHATR